MTELAPAEDRLNFQRYAPERPMLAWSRPGVSPHPGDLGQIIKVLRNAFALIRQCLGVAAGILWRRCRDWVRNRIMHSLTSAWMLCGIGWGGLIGFALVHFLAR